MSISKSIYWLHLTTVPLHTTCCNTFRSKWAVNWMKNKQPGDLNKLSKTCVTKSSHLAKPTNLFARKNWLRPFRERTYRCSCSFEASQLAASECPQFCFDCSSAQSDAVRKVEISLSILCFSSPRRGTIFQVSSRWFSQSLDGSTADWTCRREPFFFFRRHIDWRARAGKPSRTWRVGRSGEGGCSDSPKRVASVVVWK